MHESKKEKYLGDIIDNTGNQRATVKDRKSKVYGIVSQVLAITNKAPLRKWKVKIPHTGDTNSLDRCG